MSIYPSMCVLFIVNCLIHIPSSTKCGANQHHALLGPHNDQVHLHMAPHTLVKEMSKCKIQQRSLVVILTHLRAKFIVM